MNKIFVRSKKLIFLGFLFMAFMLIGMNKVEATTVTVTTYDELKEAVNGHNDGTTDTSITEVKLGADITIPASNSMSIAVINDFTLDLNGYTLDITNDNSNMEIRYGSNGVEDFTSGSLTITDTSASQTGTINLGIKPIFVSQYNTSNTGMHYKLTIDGGKFYGTSGAYNRFFEFNTDNSYYWKDKLITFDFKITKGYFEHVSTNMSSIILANDMRLNNITFNMSLDNLTFKSGNNRLIASNESYSIDDVVPEDTNFYIFNSSEDKQVLIADRSTSAKTEVPSSLWYNVDGYTNPNYAGIKLVKKDGFEVTAPTFDNANYGYGSVSAKGISIYNRGTSELQVKSVEVDKTSKFTVTGSTQPTIASKATDNTSFTINPVDGLDAGTHTATITVTDMDDKTYTATVSFIVEPKDITSTITIEDITAVTYDGDAKEPTLVVKDGSTELTVTDDYTVSYENNTNRGTATAKIATVVGSNYTWTGTKTKDFTINPKTITPTIEAIANQDYTGSEVKPSIVVKDGTTTLDLTTDYTVSYNNNQYVGEATATINPVTNSNYTFTAVSKNFNIVAADSVLRGNHTNMNGSESTPLRIRINNEELDLANNFVTLVTPSDCQSEITFTVEDDNGTGATITNNTKLTATAVGTLKVNAAFAGKDINGDGTKEYNPTNYPIFIKAIDKTPVTLTGIENNQSFEYTGRPIKPAGTLSWGGASLTENDFVYSYEGLYLTFYDPSETVPTDAGAYKMTVKVKDTNETYTGSLTVNFTISKKKVTPSIDTIPNQVYTGSEIIPEITVTTQEGISLVKDRDYTVQKYSDNINVGTGSVIILMTSIGNYYWEYSETGDITQTFEITPKTVTPSIADIGAVVYDGSAKIPTVTVSTTESVSLAPTTDYTVEYLNNTNAGTATAKLVRVSTSNYTWNGEVTKDFTINKMPVTLSVGELTEVLTYDGNAKTPTVTVSTNEGKTLEINKDYTFDYSDNINAGTATATLKIVPVDGSNYTFAAFEAKFGIERATPGITIGNLSQETGSVTAVTYEITPDVTNGRVTVEYKVEGADDSTYTKDLPTAAGKYTVKVSLTGDSNLIDKTETATLTIAARIFAVTFKDGENTIETINVAEGQKVTKPADPTKTGYTFKGWCTDNTLATEFNFENTTITENTEIFANWEKKSTSSSGGGSTSTTKYEITAEAGKGGTISPTSARVEKGEDKTFKVKAYEGYKIEDVLVDGKSVGAVSEYTFKNVKAKHEIEAKFEKISETTVPVETTWKNPFVDVSTSNWFYNAVKFVNEQELFNGMAANEFGPDVAMTRGMFVTVLSRLAAKSTVISGTATFTDVDSTMYYAKPIAWAAEKGIVNGISANEFAPEKAITREEMAVILYRYMKAYNINKPATMQLLPEFDDAKDISTWATEAIETMRNAGIINGIGDNKFDPKGTATRAQVAQIIMNFCK